MNSTNVILAKTMTKAAIALCVAYLAIVVVSSSIVTFSQQAFATVHGKCISEDGPLGVGVDCQQKHSDDVSGDAKKECREINDKCSSSQTGWGEIKNVKP